MGIDLELKVVEALSEDVGKGWARLDAEDIKALNGVLGDLIEIKGAKTTVALVTGTSPGYCGKKLIQIDGLTRTNGQIGLGELVRVKKIPRRTADTLLITPLDPNGTPLERTELDQFAKVLQGLPCNAWRHVPLLSGDRPWCNESRGFARSGPDTRRPARLRASIPDPG